MEKKKKKESVERLMCTKCNDTFSRKDNLKRHFLRHHKEEYVDNKVNKTKCLYPGCHKQFYHKNKMLEHLEQGHGVELKMEHLEFRSFEDFYQWKQEEETMKCVYFSKHTGNTKSSISDISYYMCQKDGFDKTVERKSARRNKRGVTKTGHVCPARMIVKVSLETGVVSVKYVKSHNHIITPNDIDHHPIPLHEREQIRLRKIMGVSPRKAMKEYREQRKAALSALAHINIPSDENNNRHYHGINIPDSNVIEVPDGWEIISKTKDTPYMITKQNKVCDFDHCFSKCLDVLCLGLCGHLYHCTCDDNSKICKHIHKVHSLQISSKSCNEQQTHQDITGKESSNNMNNLDMETLQTNDSIPDVETESNFTVEKTDESVDYMSMMNGQLDLIRSHLNDGSVHELLYPHITEMLQQVISQCKVELTFSTDE